MNDSTQPRWQPAWTRLSRASSTLEMVTGDLGCRAAHSLAILTHFLIMAVSAYGFVSCSSQLGFTEDKCSSNSDRVTIPWAAGAVGMITAVLLSALLGKVMGFEKRDTVDADHTRRAKYLTTLVGMIIVTSAVALVDFIMAGKAFALVEGRWFHVRLLGGIETVAGIIAWISMLLYVIKLRRVYMQRDQEHEVLAALDEYADEPEEA